MSFVVSVCVSVCMYMPLHIYMCVWRPEAEIGCFSFFAIEAESHWTQSTLLAILDYGKDTLLLYPKLWEYRYVSTNIYCHIYLFFMWCWGPNSSLHLNSSPLITELSSRYILKLILSCTEESQIYHTHIFK